MAPPTVATPPQAAQPKHPKLRRLPKNAHITKRPILRPAIPSPYASSDSPKIIYISAKTPFISAVKRVRKLLSLIDKRAMGKFDLINGKRSDKQKLKALGDQVGSAKLKEPEEVLLKGTSRAIEKVLGLALYFQGQGDCRVRLRTGSVGVVDDIVEGDGEGEKEGDEDEEVPETQVRKISVVEVGISLK